MKKKALFIALVLVQIAALTFQVNSKKGNLEVLMLENIDAMASGEWGPNAMCIGTGSVDCPKNHAKVEYVIEDYHLEAFN